ncbi:MAG: hypothetical protein U0T74_03120 [Chitinophagales bacterium]
MIFLKTLRTLLDKLQHLLKQAAGATTAVSQIGATAQVLTETAADATKMKDNLAALNKNLASLNQVYGNMLSAMKA